MASKKRKTQWQNLSHWLMGLALVACGLAGIGYLGQDIWLASTQWLIVAAVLITFGIYTKLEGK